MSKYKFIIPISTIVLFLSCSEYEAIDPETRREAFSLTAELSSSSDVDISSSSSTSDEPISSSSETEISSESSSSAYYEPIMSVKKFEVAPTSEIGNNKIKYSYSYDGYDFYYIYLGEMRYIPIYYQNAQHFGTTAEMTYQFTTSNTSMSTIHETVSKNSQLSMNIVDQYTKSSGVGSKLSAELNTKYSLESGANMKAGVVGASVKTGFEVGLKVEAEANWSQHTSNGFAETTSLTETVMHVTTQSFKEEEKFTWQLSKAKGDRTGWYRYTLLSASDVYLYVVKDQARVIYYEFREYVKPNMLGWMLDYSETMDFKKSDATSFDFDISMLDNLKKPELSFASPPSPPQLYTVTANATPNGSVELSPNLEHYEEGALVTATAMSNSNYAFDGWTGNLPEGINASSASIAFVANNDITLTANFRVLVEKTETITTAGTYTFNKGYPGTEATVDVWVLGGGGGGQGGHRWWCALAVCHGTGGGGGGGAAAYANFKVTGSVTFDTKIGGKGVPGIEGTTKSGGGYGGSGGESRVTVSGAKAFVLIAGGGGGGGTTSSGCSAESGGNNSNNYGCGAGGLASQSGISSTLKNGNHGTLGDESRGGGNTTPRGGSGGAGGIANGYSGGAGGIGGFGNSETGKNQRHSGEGGSGGVRIVIKYKE